MHATQKLVELLVAAFLDCGDQSAVKHHANGLRQKRLSYRWLVATDNDHWVAVLHKVVHQQPHQECSQCVREIHRARPVKVLKQPMQVRREAVDGFGNHAGHRVWHAGICRDAWLDFQPLHEDLLVLVVAGPAKLEVGVEYRMRCVSRDGRQVDHATVHSKQLVAD